MHYSLCQLWQQIWKKKYEAFKNGGILHCVYDVCMNRKLVCMRKNVIKKRKMQYAYVHYAWEKAVEVNVKSRDTPLTDTFYC